MQQRNIYQPYPSQAEIVVKYGFDLVEAREREMNAEDPMIAAQSYPGGSQKENLAMKQNEIIISKRESHKYSRVSQGLSQTGISTANGLHYGEYTSMEAMMRNYKFGGVLKGDYDYGGDQMFGDDPLDHGVSVTAGGSTNINNNGPEDIMSGDYLCWQLPYVEFNNGRPGASNLANTPHGKQLIQIVPFRKTDAKLSLLAIGKALERGNVSPQPGIKELKKDDLNDTSNLSPLQEEALAMREGFKVLFGGEDRLAQILANPKSEEFEALQMIADGLAGATRARLDRVIGKAISSAPKGNTCHVMLGHL